MEFLTNNKLLKLNILFWGVNIGEETVGKLQRENTKFGHGLFHYGGKYHPMSIPQEIWLSPDTVVRVQYNEHSPFSLEYVNTDHLYLHYQGKLVRRVHLGERSTFYDEILSNGKPAYQIIQVNGKDRLNVYAFNFCTFSNKNVACRFCNVSASGPYLDVQIRKRNALIAEAVELANRYAAFRHLCFSGGVTPTPDGGAENFIQILHAIRERLGWKEIDGDVSMVPPGNLEYIDQLFETGISTISMNIEVYDPDLFQKYCPGKYEIGMDEYIRTFQYVVDKFGWGRVRTNFVLGLERLETFKEGTEKLASMGVVPTTNVYWQSTEENLRHPQAMDLSYYLEAYAWLAKIYERYKLKPIWCSDCTIASLDNECHLLSERNRVIF